MLLTFLFVFAHASRLTLDEFEAILANKSSRELEEVNDNLGSFCTDMNDKKTALSEPERWVKAHNYFRCLYDMPSMQWNEKVETNAQEWATESCDVMKHSDSYNNDPPSGENLAWHSGANAQIEHSVYMWYNEVKDYPNTTGDSSIMTGHYTAMMWKTATQLGCSQCKGLSVCQYSSDSGNISDAPNMGGKYEQNLPPHDGTAGSTEMSQDEQYCCRSVYEEIELPEDYVVSDPPLDTNDSNLNLSFEQLPMNVQSFFNRLDSADSNHADAISQGEYMAVFEPLNELQQNVLLKILEINDSNDTNSSLSKENFIHRLVTLGFTNNMDDLNGLFEQINLTIFPRTFEEFPSSVQTFWEATQQSDYVDIMKLMDIAIKWNEDDFVEEMKEIIENGLEKDVFVRNINDRYTNWDQAESHFQTLYNQFYNRSYSWSDLDASVKSFYDDMQARFQIQIEPVEDSNDSSQLDTANNSNDKNQPNSASDSTDTNPPNTASDSNDTNPPNTASDSNDTNQDDTNGNDSNTLERRLADNMNNSDALATTYPPWVDNLVSQVGEEHEDFIQELVVDFGLNVSEDEFKQIVSIIKSKSKYYFTCYQRVVNPFDAVEFDLLPSNVKEIYESIQMDIKEIKNENSIKSALATRHSCDEWMNSLSEKIITNTLTTSEFASLYPKIDLDSYSKFVSIVWPKQPKVLFPNAKKFYNATKDNNGLISNEVLSNLAQNAELNEREKSLVTQLLSKKDDYPQGLSERALQWRVNDYGCGLISECMFEYLNHLMNPVPASPFANLTGPAKTLYVQLFEDSNLLMDQTAITNTLQNKVFCDKWMPKVMEAYFSNELTEEKYAELVSPFMMNASSCPAKGFGWLSDKILPDRPTPFTSLPQGAQSFFNEISGEDKEFSHEERDEILNSLNGRVRAYVEEIVKSSDSDDKVSEYEFRKMVTAMVQNTSENETNITFNFIGSFMFPPTPLPFDEQDDVFKTFYVKLVEDDPNIEQIDDFGSYQSRLLDQTDDTNNYEESRSDTNELINTSEMSDVPSEVSAKPEEDSNMPKKSPLELLKETIPSLEEKEQFVLESIIESVEDESLTKESYSGYITSMRIWHKSTKDLFSYLLTVVDPPEPVNYAELDTQSKEYFEKYHNEPNKMESLGEDLDEFLNVIEKPIDVLALKSIISNDDLTEEFFCQKVALFRERAEDHFRFINAFIDSSIKTELESSPPHCSELFTNMLDKPSSKFTFETIRDNREEAGKISPLGLKVFKRILSVAITKENFERYMGVWNMFDKELMDEKCEYYTDTFWPAPETVSTVELFFQAFGFFDESEEVQEEMKENIAQCALKALTDSPVATSTVKVLPKASDISVRRNLDSGAAEIVVTCVAPNLEKPKDMEAFDAKMKEEQKKFPALANLKIENTTMTVDTNTPPVVIDMNHPNLNSATIYSTAFILVLNVLHMM